MLLDLCCGTGTLTWELARRGYEMIAVDQSPDMLMEAQSKAVSDVTPPLFICQEAGELDLYGTVDAAVCSLDGMNYIPAESCGAVSPAAPVHPPGGAADLRYPRAGVSARARRGYLRR